MRRLQTPEERAKYIDPFSNDPLRAIDIIRCEHKPLFLTLRIPQADVGNQESYRNLETALVPYGAVLSPYVDFSDCVGLEMKDFEKAKQLVRDQQAGKIPGVTHISVDSLTMQLCDNYSRIGHYH